MRVEGLTLSHDGVDVRGDFSRMRPRVRAGVLSKELLVRACRVKGAFAPVAMDFTAGLGEDSFLLAASGFSVTLLERNPVVAALLADAMERARKDPELAGIVARMTLVQGDALDALDEAMHDGRQPDVVYLDPMFPEKRKDAVAKKKLQLIQRLEAPCDDESTLLDAALTAGPRKGRSSRAGSLPMACEARRSATIATFGRDRSYTYVTVSSRGLRSSCSLDGFASGAA